MMLLLMLLFQKRKKKFGTFFSFLGTWDRKSDKYGAVRKIMTGLRYKLGNWYAFLDIEGTYTVAK